MCGWVRMRGGKECVDIRHVSMKELMDLNNTFNLGHWEKVGPEVLSPFDKKNGKVGVGMGMGVGEWEKSNPRT